MPSGIRKKKLDMNLYNENREVVAKGTSNGTITRYIRGLGSISFDSEEAKTYYHYVSDEQGSITHVLSEDAEILYHYSYDAFGNIVEKTEKVENCLVLSKEESEDYRNKNTRVS